MVALPAHPGGLHQARVRSCRGQEVHQQPNRQSRMGMRKRCHFSAWAMSLRCEGRELGQRMVLRPIRTRPTYQSSPILSTHPHPTRHHSPSTTTTPPPPHRHRHRHKPNRPNHSPPAISSCGPTCSRLGLGPSPPRACGLVSGCNLELLHLPNKLPTSPPPFSKRNEV